ncbi:MAG: GtrA family protein [Alphaproteobacteria bacterium]|nr:GtrA family protein [Alphaproteobacteria bacterium]
MANLVMFRRTLAEHGPQMVRFAIVGVINTAIDFAIFSALHFGVGFGIVAANVLAFLVAVTNSFIMNRAWTFAGRKGSGRIRYQLPMFVALNTVGLVLSTVTVLALSEMMQVLAAKVCAIVVVFLWNYATIQRFVYRAD